MPGNADGNGPGPARTESPDRRGGFDPSGSEEERLHAGGPTWRPLVLAVAAAIVLSAVAALLLGGSFGFAKGEGATGCGSARECCPPADPPR